MSRVFVAEETALGRQVVVKVLPPELAAALNVERFRREIQLAAPLQHPHIVPVHSAGQADGLLYFTMPLVEGEPLRARLGRQGEQSVVETIRILRDIVDALVYAHGRGVVHRDIKPDNVLLSHHHALVTDFGVAKALSASTGQGSFTSAGIALGTPAYMAPEQAAADPHADHRVDIYALGAVAYEMLTGRPPFTGPTPQAILAAQVTKSAEPIGALRPGAPSALQAMVMRCLEKQPADRWQTAEELLQQLEAIATPSAGMAPTMPVPASGNRRSRTVAVAGLLVLAATAGFLWSRNGSPDAGRPLAQNVVAVFPFRVSGAAPQLAYLGEGMMDLLATQLTGEGGPRAVDPRASLSAWQRAGGSSPAESPDAALRAARELGAGTVIEGSVVGTPERLVLTAALRDARTGDATGQAKLEGTADSLPALVDRLTGQLLLQSAGKRDRALATLTQLPALRAYLDGQASRRRGDYDSALARFGRALDLDSTLAPAAMGLVAAASYSYVGDRDPGARPRGARLAWQYRDRLSPVDRAILAANLGPRYPATSPLAEWITAADEAVRSGPDSPEAWLAMGEWSYHYGPATSMAGWRERARAAFTRAVELDPSFTDPYIHLFQLLMATEDTATLRRLGAAFLARDSASDLADYFRWQVALGTGDSAELGRIRARFDRMSERTLDYVGIQCAMDGVGCFDARRASALRLGQPMTRRQLGHVARARFELMLVMGRPTEADSAFRIFEQNAEHPLFAPLTRVTRFVFIDGDTTGVARAVAMLESAQREPPMSAADSIWGLAATCVLAQWQLNARRTTAARASIARLSDAVARGDPAAAGANSEACATVAGAWAAALDGGPGAPDTLGALDSLMRLGVVHNGFMGGVGESNLIAARAFEELGDHRRALAAIRRRVHHYSSSMFMGTALRQEARLAELAGERDGAIGAYRQWLATHDDPEPSVLPEVTEVKAELAKLVGEPGGP